MPVVHRFLFSFVSVAAIVIGANGSESVQVVITKCYHLFCSPCVQKIIGSRHRKCPSCAASFGSNDVKPVYI